MRDWNTPTGDARFRAIVKEVATRAKHPVPSVAINGDIGMGSYTPENRIEYTPEFLNSIDADIAKTSAIVAHEVGHIASGNVLTPWTSCAEQHRNELNADAYAYKLGYDIIAALQTSHTTVDTCGHPSKYHRIAAIKALSAGGKA